MRQIRNLTVGLLVPLLVGACGGSKKAATESAPREAPDAGAAAAPPGTTRYVFATDSFEIPPGKELYKCQDFPNPFGKDIAILQSESVMTTGSHHMFAFRIGPNDASPLNLGADGGKGPLVDCPEGGGEFHPYFHDAQLATRVFDYPAGVGRSLKANEGVRLMIHFLNVTETTLKPSLRVTVDYVDAAAVQALAAEYFISAFQLNVPPGLSTQTYSFVVPSDMQVLSAVSHMHARGTHFVGEVFSPSDAGVKADAGGGTVLYSSDTWVEPKPDDFKPPVALQAGDVMRFACSYENDTGEPFVFGQSALTNEMCIFQGTYYPAVDGTGILGLPTLIGH